MIGRSPNILQVNPAILLFVFLFSPSYPCLLVQLFSLLGAKCRRKSLCLVLKVKRDNPHVTITSLPNYVLHFNGCEHKYIKLIIEGSWILVHSINSAADPHTVYVSHTFALYFNKPEPKKLILTLTPNFGPTLKKSHVNVPKCPHFLIKSSE